MNKEHMISDAEKKKLESGQYLSGGMDKNIVIELLRKEGFRITRQRKILIDIILNEDCTCCKEIYYLASKQERGIGVATIYRTISALEKIGALKRKNPYQVCGGNRMVNGKIFVELEDSSVVELDLPALHHVMETGLEKCGYSGGKGVKKIRYMWDRD